jgi:hypothetical protein
MINKYRAGGGMIIGKENLNIRRDPASVHFFALNPTLSHLGFNPGSNGAKYEKKGHARRIIRTR